MLKSISITALASAALGLTVLATAPADAQPRTISVPAGEDWDHEWTALEFPAKIGGFERERISAFEPRQTNVAANYFEESTGTYLTVYIYRPGNPVAPIWFDRALMAIGFRGEEYGKVDVDEAKIGSFVPQGGTVESGQMAVTKVDGRFNSTAVALYQAGEWLVKLRISSRKLDVSEMETLTKATLATLPSLEAVSTQPAYFVTQCASLAQFGDGKPYKPEGDKPALGALIGTVLGQISSSGSATDGGKSAKYCREGQRERQLNIFRTEEPGSGYIVALGDAGASVEVVPVGALGASPGRLDIPEDLYAIRSSTGLKTDYFTPYTGLPNVRQVGGAFSSDPIARVNRSLGNEATEVKLLTGSGDDN